MDKMDEIINLYKPPGMTPLEAIEAFRAENPQYKNTKMTYAGRLDPLAFGVLIVLTGEKIYEKDKYLKLEKEYEADILFGFASDTYDILGVIADKSSEMPSEELIKKKLSGISACIELPIPAFSSYKIKGRPLFVWAREGKLNEIKIPKRKMNIYTAQLIDFSKMPAAKLLEHITDKINGVRGDFRQEEIKRQWKDILSEFNEEYFIAKIKFKVSSGTYIRSIANKLGDDSGFGAVLFNLKRTSAGEFDIDSSIKLSEYKSPRP